MISSEANSQLKNISALLKKSKERQNQKLFVAEGRKMFFEALALKRLSKAYFSESFFDENKEELLERFSDSERDGFTVEYETVSDSVFKKIAETVTPQGVIALVKMPTYNPEDVVKKAKAIVVLENLQDPGNLGTIVRTAESAGMDAVVLSEGSVDIFNPKVVRSTMGSVYRMPVLYIEDIVGFVKRLNGDGFNTIATHLHATASFTEADYSGKTAVLIGNEGNGLTAEITAAASEKVIIPMSGNSESLNASVAAALMMYEIKRQTK